MCRPTEKLSAPALGAAVGRGGGEGGEVHVERICHLVHGRALGIGVNVGVDVHVMLTLACPR